MHFVKYADKVRGISDNLSHIGCKNRQAPNSNAPERMVVSMDQERWTNVSTYQDGERGGVHHRAEDDAEDADDHGALLVGVRGQEHREHHDDHESRLPVLISC